MLTKMDKEEKELIDNVLERVLEDHVKELEETPFYHNTSNCQLSGAVDELKSINTRKISSGGIFCYIVGRINALEKLKEELINEKHYK